MNEPAVLSAPGLPGTIPLPTGISGPVLAATAGWLREHADAPSTQRAYLRDLSTWIDWCTTQRVDPRPARNSNDLPLLPDDPTTNTSGVSATLSASSSTARSRPRNWSASSGWNTTRPTYGALGVVSASCRSGPSHRGLLSPS
jgi:hypothetical protein